MLGRVTRRTESAPREPAGNVRRVMRLDMIVRLWIGVAACALVAARSAQASEERRVEVAGGYSLLSVGTCSAQTCNSGDTSETFPAGWFASGGMALSDWIMAVGEVSGNYKSSSDSLGDVTATA